jgi:hypothetical protein
MSQLQGLFTVNLFKGTIAKSADVFGKMDPYVIVEIGDQRAQSSIHKKGHKAPQWNESFQYVLDGSETFVQLSLYDHDVGSDDDLIGIVKIPLLAAIQDNIQTEWPVVKKNKTKGTLQITFTWQGTTAEQREKLAEAKVAENDDAEAETVDNKESDKKECPQQHLVRENIGKAIDLASNIHSRVTQVGEQNKFVKYGLDTVSWTLAWGASKVGVDKDTALDLAKSYSDPVIDRLDKNITTAVNTVNTVKNHVEGKSVSDVTAEVKTQVTRKVTQRVESVKAQVNQRIESAHTYLDVDGSGYLNLGDLVLGSQLVSNVIVDKVKATGDKVKTTGQATIESLREFSSGRLQKVVHIDLVAYAQQVIDNTHKNTAKPAYKLVESQLEGAVLQLKKTVGETKATLSSKTPGVVVEINSKISPYTEGLKTKLASVATRARTLAHHGTNHVLSRPFASLPRDTIEFLTQLPFVFSENDSIAIAPFLPEISRKEEYNASVLQIADLVNALKEVVLLNRWVEQQPEQVPVANAAAAPATGEAIATR